MTAPAKTRAAAAEAAPAAYKFRLRDWLQKLPWSLVAGHIGVLAAVGAYYVATQENGWITYHWNHLLPWAWWTPVRHAIRNGILEGFLGSGFAALLLVNPLKGGKFTRWDALMCRIHAPNHWQGYRTTGLQYLFSPLSALLAGLPGFLLGFGIFFGIPAIEHRFSVDIRLFAAHVTGHHAAVSQSPVSQEINLWKSAWTAKVIGAMGMVLRGRTVIFKVGSDLQLFLAERQLGKYKAARTLIGRFFHKPHMFNAPPGYRQVWKSVKTADKAGRGQPEARNRFAGWCMVAVLPLILASAWWGSVILARIKS